MGVEINSLPVVVLISFWLMSGVPLGRKARGTLDRWVKWKGEEGEDRGEGKQIIIEGVETVAIQHQQPA